MFRRFLIVLAIIFVGTLTYFYVVDVIDKKRMNIRIQSAYVKARECEKTQASRCFAELAVLHLPFYTRFSGYDRLGRDLRYLGFGNLVDARMKASEFQYADTDRHSIRLVELLVGSVEAFEAEPPHTDPFVYSSTYFRLVDDFPGFGGGWGADFTNAEKAALARRGPPDLLRLTDALLRKWRESLHAYADRGLDWLFYASRARALGATDEAKDALSKALELGVSNTSDWTVVYETWQLYGLDAGLAAVADIPDSNERASTYLNIANRLFKKGDTVSATAVFQKFNENYDEDEPVRLPTNWQRMARSAALLSYRLHDSEQAIVWADKYAKGNPFAGRTINALEAAELYVDVGAENIAVKKAYEAIEHAPEPGKTAWGPWLSRVSTTPYYNGYVGRAIGVLCKAGRFEEAFSLTENNPDIGSSAVNGCRVAIEGATPKMTIESLTASLSLHTPRQLQFMRAAGFVETGEYEAATQFIKGVLTSPPVNKDGSLASANLPYLRLAVAMRDEKLAREIMTYIAANSSSLDGKSATTVFATVASYTHKWPDNLITN